MMTSDEIHRAVWIFSEIFGAIGLSALLLHLNGKVFPDESFEQAKRSAEPVDGGRDNADVS
jgi:hypothetical protein